MPNPRALAGEFIGTFIFVTVAAGSVIVTNSQIAPLGVFGVAAANGLALAIVVTGFAAISGGHVNPAVTISLWLGGRIRSRDALLYIIVQVVAGIAAGGVLLGMLGRIADQINLGTPGPRAGLAIGRVILIEAVFTFFVVIAHWMTVTDERGRHVGGFGVGMMFFASMLLAAQLSGGALNPARHIGPAIVALHFRYWWVYWAGPVIGGIVAGLIYPTLLLDRHFPWRLVPAEPQTEDSEPPTRRGRGR